MDIAQITTFAKEILLETGECHPTVFVEVEGDTAPYVLPFINFPFRDTEERERGLFVAARHFAYKVRKHLKRKKVITLAFACKGWGVRMQKTEQWTYTRPSEHPERCEVLFITMLDTQSMQQEITAYEMVRTGGSVDLLAMTEKPSEARSSLLPAFFTGIETATLPEGMARAKLRRICEEYSASRD